MPLLNVSNTVRSPMFADAIVVKRRPEVISSKGVSTVPTVVTTPTLGVVTAANPNDLMRLEESDRTERTISIVSEFRLQATVKGFKPDIVVWRGDNYVVKDVQPYPQFGPGFVQALAGSIDYQDVNPA
jgi:hypothetical protein